MSKIMFSPSSLGLFNECPRCFWLDRVFKIKRPRGIFPSLPSGVDGVLKIAYDSARKYNVMPKSIEQALPGYKLYKNQEQLDKMRNWRSGLRVEPEGRDYYLTGALDDLIEKDGLFSPFDAKTKGSEPDPSHIKYYQFQLDFYALLLKENNFPLTGEGFISVYYPSFIVDETSESVKMDFSVRVISTKVHPETIIPIADAAMKCLHGPIPEPSEECEVCGRNRSLRSQAVMIKQAVNGLLPASHDEMPTIEVK